MVKMASGMDNGHVHPTTMMKDDVAEHGGHPANTKSCSLGLQQISFISIYTVSDLGVLSNLIGSLSLANEHYSPPTE